MRFKRLLLFLCLAGFAGCGRSAPHETTASLAGTLGESAACVDFSVRLTEGLQRLLLDHQELPSADDVRSALSTRIGDRPGSSFAAAEITKVYETLVVESRRRLGISDTRDLLATITALEIGDRTTPEKIALREKLDVVYSLARKAAVAAGLTCQTSPHAADDAANTNAKPSSVRARRRNETGAFALPVRGALRVLATAYQSCRALEVPALTSDSPSVSESALTYKGRYGKGRLYEVKNAALLMSTHYYLREAAETGDACFDLSKKPMIYDFGGKPYADPGVGTTLDLFRNNPGGPTQSLGIDCSAFVFSSLATVGLKLRTGDLRPADVYGVSAAMMMNPTKNGLDCLEPVRTTPTTSLLEGDLLASTGHVVMIGHLGRDPWGIAGVDSIADCTTATISTSRFDFEVLQSAPVKGRVGIDRMRAADYLEESPTMKAALQTYAVAACKAKFGLSGIVSPSKARLVRHTGTDECIANEIPLERESCVRSCVEQLNSWNELELGGGFR